MLFNINLKISISTKLFGLAREYCFLIQAEPVTEVKDEENSATTAMTTGDQSAAMEGYKRKMDDQEGSRAAKNPRSSSPTFSSLEVSTWGRGSLVPRPCTFVTCSTKFAQRAWARSPCDVCHSRVFTSPDNNVCRVAYIHVQWSFKLKQVKRVR